MKVRHKETLVAGTCNELNPSSLTKEIIVIFEDGTRSSEGIWDYEVELSGGWWDLADAIHNGDVITDDANARLYVNIRGLYGKYIVKKASGPTDPDANYFVLRLDTDEAAREAALTYARAVQNTRPKLSAELLALLAKLGQPAVSCYHCSNTQLCHTWITIQLLLTQAFARNQFTSTEYCTAFDYIASACACYEAEEEAASVE